MTAAKAKTGNPNSNPARAGDGKRGGTRTSRKAGQDPKHLADTWAPELGALLDHLSVGRAVNLQSCVVVPLSFEGDAPAADAYLLEEALAEDLTTVEEVSEFGNVPSLRVRHRGMRPLLLVDGEQVLGGKQNRIFNTSMLVLPGVVAEVPVSCVEAGRWAHNRHDFTASGVTLHAFSRGRKVARVAESAVACCGYDADQSEVWADVDEFLERTEADNATAAYSEGAEKITRERGDLLKKLRPGKRQIGVAVVRGKKLICMDVFGSPALYHRSWEKIARGILSEVVPMPAPHPSPGNTVKKALDRIRRATGKRQIPAPGCGETLHGGTRSLKLGAVAHDGAVYHAVAAGV